MLNDVEQLTPKQTLRVYLRSNPFAHARDSMLSWDLADIDLERQHEFVDSEGDFVVYLKRGGYTYVPKENIALVVCNVQPSEEVE